MASQDQQSKLPPRWVDRLLAQFCAPELLEEVLGDLHERYYRRVKKEGVRKAQRKYWRDVVSYFRFSVLKKPSTYTSTLISPDMIRNYLKIAWRNLYYNKFFSLINIFGLALGIVCSILISLWIVDELSWDKFHTNIDRIYRVYMNRPGDDGTFTQTVVSLATWEPLKDEAGIKHVIPTNNGRRTMLAYGDKAVEKTFYQVGEDFLRTFNFKLLEGTLDKQLNDPSSIVLTESTAKALFGSESALGKTLRVDNQVDLTVSGVVEDPPRQSTLQFEGLISLKVIASLDPEFQEYLSNWNNSSHLMYIELEEGVNPLQVEDQIRDWMKPHYEEAEFMLFPLEGSRLYSEFENGKSVGGAIKYVQIFAIVAILILALACINFANLTTAQSEKRAREVGIRKTAGSRRWQLITQFLSETMVIAFISFGIAILLVEALLPSYNSLVNKNLALDYGNPLLWGSAFAFLLVTGIAAGSYPAFFLSASQPLKVLRGRGSSKRGNLPLKVMVTLQFFFSIGLMICTGVIYSQIHYIKNQDIGYDKEHLLTVSTKGEVEENYDLIKRDLLEQSLSSSVTVSSSPITGLRAWSKPNWQGKDDNQDGYFTILSVGYDYTQTLDAKILLGREFDQNFSDSSSMLINQAAVDYMGLDDPIGMSVELYGQEHTVVGVLDDITMGSPYEPSQRTAFIFRPDWTSNMLIRLPEETNISQTMKGIEEVFQNHNPAFPFSYSFVDEEFDRKFANEELIGKLANIFALLAIIISCLGLFGLSAFAAERRTKEVGIRKALGASITHIVSLLSREFVKLVLIAMVFAVPLAWYVMRQWLQNFTYQVEVAWWMYALVGLLAIIVAQLTVSFQSIRAALANPVDSLRNE